MGPLSGSLPPSSCTILLLGSPSINTPAHFPAPWVLPNSRLDFFGYLCLEHSAPRASHGWQTSALTSHAESHPSWPSLFPSHHNSRNYPCYDLVPYCLSPPAPLEWKLHKNRDPVSHHCRVPTVWNSEGFYQYLLKKAVRRESQTL